MSRVKLYSTEAITVKDLTVQVLRKKVKNLNLRVYPNEKKIRVSVPKRIPKNEIVQFIQKKYPWIKEKLSKPRNKPSQKPLKYTSGEKHSIWGRDYTLQIIERSKPPHVFLCEDDTVVLQVRPGSTLEKKKSVLKEWYRAELKNKIPDLIEKWERPMEVEVREFGVKQMKTRWGTCNIRDRRIWLNLELAKKKPELLEYVVVHEMIHLLERLHNKRFYRLMASFLPNWRELELDLNGKNHIRNC